MFFAPAHSALRYTVSQYHSGLSGAAQENLLPESVFEPEEPPDSAAENLPPESVSEPEESPDSAADSGAEPEDVPEEETGLSGLGAEESELEGVRFGVYDSLNGYFLRLPLAWRGGIVLADGALRGDWLVRDAGTNEVLVSVKAVDRDETASSDTYVFAGVTEEKKVYVSVPSRVDETAARIITGGFSLMQ